jgi:hypothetical protein
MMPADKEPSFKFFGLIKRDNFWELNT